MASPQRLVASRLTTFMVRWEVVLPTMIATRDIRLLR